MWGLNRFKCVILIYNFYIRHKFNNDEDASSNLTPGNHIFHLSPIKVTILKFTFNLTPFYGPGSRGTRMSLFVALIKGYNIHSTGRFQRVHSAVPLHLFLKKVICCFEKYIFWKSFLK